MGGLLKSELGDDIAEEVVIINPKSYSIKTIKRTNSANCSVNPESLREARFKAADRIQSLNLERVNQHMLQKTLPLPQREWWLPLCHPTPQTLAEDIRKNCQEEIENAARIKSQLENIARKKKKKKKNGGRKKKKKKKKKK